MFTDLLTALGSHPRLFTATALVVLLLALGSSALSVLSAPDVYSSTATVRLSAGVPPFSSTGLTARLLETECEVIRSEVVLGRVITRLELTTLWAPQQPAALGRFGVSEAMALLKTALEVSPLEATNSVAIRARSGSAREAADLANAVAEAYQAHQQELLTLDPPVTGAIQVQSVGRAEPTTVPLRSLDFSKSALVALGAILLALAAATAMASVAFLVTGQPHRLDVFVPLFITIFLALFGHGLLVGRANLTLSASGGLLLAFAVAAFAHWLREVAAHDYPVRPTTHFTIFVVVFLAVFGTGTLGIFVGSPGYVATARVRLSAVTADLSDTNATDAIPPLLDLRFLRTECQVIQSDAVLDHVIGELNLCATWGEVYAGGEKLKTQETRSLLQARVDARPVHKTSLIEIRVYHETAADTAHIANAIAASYRQHCSRSAFAGQHFPALRVEIVDGDASVPSPLRLYRQRRWARELYDGLFLAFIAVAGSIWATVLIHQRRPRIAQLLVLAVAVGLLAYVVSLACGTLMPETYSSAAQIRLRTTAATGRSCLPAACDLIRSDAILNAVVNRLRLPKAAEPPGTNAFQARVEAATQRLRKRLYVHPVSDTYLIAIRVAGEAPDETARTANTIAEVYCDYQRGGLSGAPPAGGHFPADILERAVPAIKPTQSNNPLTLPFERLWAPLLSFLLGAGVAWLASVFHACRGPKS